MHRFILFSKITEWKDLNFFAFQGFVPRISGPFVGHLVLSPLCQPTNQPTNQQPA